MSQAHDFDASTLTASTSLGRRSTRVAREADDGAAVRDVLFVVPNRRGGLQATIRGHVLELAEPTPAHRLAPAPDDLFIASIASDLAWSTRQFLRAHGVPDDVSVTAEWRTGDEPPRLADVSIAVTVSESAQELSAALEDTLAERVAARSLTLTRLHLRCVR